VKFVFLTRILRRLFPPVFTVVIESGRALKTQGRLRAIVLADFDDIAREQNLKTGTLLGVSRQGGVQLQFSPEIKESDRQRFRNAWYFHEGSH